MGGYYRQFILVQVWMGSESHYMLGQLNRILKISDSEAGLKVEKSGVIVYWKERKS